MARVRLTLFALSLVAAPLGAQQVNGHTPGILVPAATEQAAVVTSVTRGPTVESGRVAASIPESTAPRALYAPQRANLGQARALMIVGGAAILAGAIIGDDPGAIIMVGGAVVGLIGLYEYLQ